MLVNAKLDCQLVKGLPFKVADFIGLFNFEWHGQNKVGNIAILVLWRYLAYNQTPVGDTS